MFPVLSKKSIQLWANMASSTGEMEPNKLCISAIWDDESALATKVAAHDS